MLRPGSISPCTYWICKASKTETSPVSVITLVLMKIDICRADKSGFMGVNHSCSFFLKEDEFKAEFYGLPGLQDSIDLSGWQHLYGLNEWCHSLMHLIDTGRNVKSHDFGRQDYSNSYNTLP